MNDTQVARCRSEERVLQLLAMINLYLDKNKVSTNVRVLFLGREKLTSLKVIISCTCILFELRCTVQNVISLVCRRPVVATCSSQCLEWWQWLHRWDWWRTTQATSLSLTSTNRSATSHHPGVGPSYCHSQLIDHDTMYVGGLFCCVSLV